MGTVGMDERVGEPVGKLGLEVCPPLPGAHSPQAAGLEWDWRGSLSADPGRQLSCAQQEERGSALKSGVSLRARDR